MTSNHCGDTCGLIDFTMAVAGDRLLPEERMKLAIEAVTSGKMSQRGAAAKYGVNRDTLQRRLKEVAEIGHPTETQSTTEVSAVATPLAKDGALPKRHQIQKELRALAKAHGMTHAGNIPVSKAGQGQIYTALIEAGHDVPSDITPTSKKAHDTHKQGVSANDPFPVIPDRPTETDPEDDAILDERIDLNKLSQQVLSDVISSTRSDSFKRAATLATELEQLLCLAFYGKDGWSGQDWVHINGQLKTCQSLTGQRSEEAHCAVFHERYSEGGAVAV